MLRICGVRPALAKICRCDKLKTVLADHSFPRFLQGYGVNRLFNRSGVDAVVSRANSEFEKYGVKEWVKNMKQVIHDSGLVRAGKR